MNELVISMNSIASDPKNKVSEFSKNGSILSQWSGSGLSPINPLSTYSSTKIIASGIPVKEISPIYASVDGINNYNSVSNILNNTLYEFAETGKIIFNGTVYVTSVRHLDKTSSRLIYSKNGVTWSDSRMSVNDVIQDICSDRASCIAISKNMGPIYSSDGTSWSHINTFMNSNPDNYFCNVVSLGSKWLISAFYNGSSSIYSSSDTVSWNLLSNIPSPTTFMKYNGKILIVGYSSFIQYSLDQGETFIDSPSRIFPSGCNDVAWNGNLWVAVGPGINTIATSADGITWNGLGNTIFTEGTSICWNSTHWVAGGSGTNSMAYSINGIDWIGTGNTTFTKITALCSSV